MVTNKKKDTICWKCGNAVPTTTGTGCSWSRKLVPVDGWEAKPTWKDGEIVSYCVINCPLFTPDTTEIPPGGEDKYQELANAIIKQAAQDYRTECKQEQRTRMEYPGWLIMRRLYKGKWTGIFGQYRKPLSMTKNEQFFTGEYAASLTTINPRWIMNEIRKECGLEVKHG